MEPILGPTIGDPWNFPWFMINGLIKLPLFYKSNFGGFPENHNAWSFGWYYNDPCKSKGQHTHSSIGEYPFAIEPQSNVLELEWIILKRCCLFKNHQWFGLILGTTHQGSCPPGSDRSVKPSVGWDFRVSERPSYLFGKLTWHHVL